ncbi:MAG: hypothetical protein DMD81_05910 [Candidatus Rokuibacteriota bacterium]|nr:MAG: hypothetical protein DMD81_05910 [Candidatus Rokubacteria bacterium]
MRRFILIVPLALGLLTTGSVAGWANDAQRPARADGQQRFQQWLGLTDDQAAQLKELRAKNADAWRQVGTALRQAQQDLRQAALNGADPATIQAKEADVTKYQAQMLDLRVKGLQDMATVLTPEQKQKLAQAPMGPRFHRRGPAQTPSS